MPKLAGVYQSLHKLTKLAQNCVEHIIKCSENSKFVAVQTRLNLVSLETFFKLKLNQFLIVLGLAAGTLMHTMQYPQTQKPNIPETTHSKKQYAQTS